jgi:peptide deformylase
LIKEIIKYPTPPSVEYSTDVRFFNQDLVNLIVDLTDTIKENNLQGLAAYQIGNQYNVIVIKNDDGTFLELINPRIISQNGQITTKEETSYFPNLSANVTRHDNITVVYQDRNGKDKSLKASGDLSVLLQRKIDYTFGSTFLNKLSKDEKKTFEKKLEFGSDLVTPESCPVFSYKDYVLKFGKLLLLGIFVLFIGLLFSSKGTSSDIFHYQLYISLGSVLIGFIYLIVGYIEGKKYSSCTSCQVGNLVGTTLIYYFKLTILMILSYIFI